MYVYPKKTHKFPPDHDLATLDLELVKVRPIISCSGSPGEKLAWLVAQILNPILNHVPHHLKNTHEHLNILCSLPPEEIVSLNL